jgi:hypothetical protein
VNRLEPARFSREQGCYTIVEPYTRRKQLLEHLMWNGPVSEMLNYNTHFRVVTEIAILLVKPEVRHVKMEDQRRWIAVELLEDVLFGEHCRFLVSQGWREPLSNPELTEVCRLHWWHDFICFDRCCSCADTRKARSLSFAPLAESLRGARRHDCCRHGASW